MSGLITIEMLEQANACAEQRDEFELRFGDSVRVTQRRAVSVAGVFDWGFAATKLLSKAQRAEYYRVTAPARTEYHRATAAARTKYKTACAKTFAKAYNN